MNPTADPKIVTEMLERIARVLARVETGLERFRRGEDGRFVYYADSRRPWCLYASYTGLHASWMLGLTGRWPAERLRASLDLLLEHQDPADGGFHCPVCAADPVDERQACQDENPTFVAGVTWKIADLLAAFGERPRYPVVPPSAEELPDPPEEWLEQNFSQFNPYSAGSRVGHLAGLRGLVARLDGREPAEDPLIRRVYDWLVARQDESGFFCAGEDLVNGMNGLLKMRRNLFDGIGLPVPNARRVAETILSMQRPDGRYGGACEDWNASTLMISCGVGSADLRGRIAEALRCVVAAIEAKQDAYGALAFEPGEEGWLVATNVQVSCLRAVQGFCEFLRTV
jgi:hypothetical protein